MTTLSKEDAIRAVLDGKKLEQRYPGGEWADVIFEFAFNCIAHIISVPSAHEFRVKCDPVVRYISKHHLDAGWSDSTFLREVYPPTDILRVEAYPDGSYKVTRVEE